MPPPYHRNSKTVFTSCLAITLSLPVSSFLLVPAAPGLWLGLPSTLNSHSLQPCSCSIGCSKERKEDLAEMSHLFLCWKASESTLSVHAEQRKVGFCQDPPPVTHLRFDDSLQSQRSAHSQLISSPTANGLRNHQPSTSPLASLLPELAREGPM